MKFLPGINAVCVGRMIFWAMVVILFLATFVKILNETFNRHIGLYCWINFASFFFGKRIIVPKLRQCKGIPETKTHQVFFYSILDKTLVGTHPTLVLCCAPFGKLLPSLQIPKIVQLITHFPVEALVEYHQFFIRLE